MSDISALTYNLKSNTNKLFDNLVIARDRKLAGQDADFANGMSVQQIELIIGEINEGNIYLELCLGPGTRAPELDGPSRMARHLSSVFKDVKVIGEV